MAKKGGVVALQIEVDNDNDWEKLVKREGLIMVDVYSDWSGPCTGMTGALRKIKLEIGGDVLTLAIAKCDNITCLSRFRNKSRPTWMFISNKRMIRLLFGANTPTLVSILIEEIEKTQKAIAENIPREGIDFDQLTEEEQKVVDEEIRIKEEAERIEREAKEKVINDRREAIAENLIGPLKDYNFVMLWSHVGNDGMGQIISAVKQTHLTVAGKPIKRLLTDADIYEMLFYSTWKYSDIELDELQCAEVTALLFQGMAGENEEIAPVEVFLETFYGAMKAPPGEEDSLAAKLSTVIKIRVEPEVQEDEEETSQKSSIKDQKPASKEPALLHISRKLTEKQCSALQDQENIVSVVIPGLHVPENDKCKVLAMRILFPNITVKMDLPEPPFIPPHLIVVFETFKKNEVLQLAIEWPEGTMRLGFFTSAEADNAKLIAKTVEQFDKIVAPPYDSKLIVQVSKMKSEPLLSYAALGPVYLSPNCVVGEKECEKLFPEGYDVPELEEEQGEELKKKKKKKKGAKTTVTSDNVKTSVESGEGGFEEGLEETEKEEEEDEADDDDDVLAECQEHTEEEEDPSPTADAEVEADKATTTEPEQI